MEEEDVDLFQRLMKKPYIEIDEPVMNMTHRLHRDNLRLSEEEMNNILSEEGNLIVSHHRS